MRAKQTIILVLSAFMTIGSLQSQIEGNYASVNGIKMYYEIHGTGSPLVLIHGGGSTITTTFGKIMPELAKTHQVIAVELQAHGHTSDRNTPESFEQDADDVAGLLQQLNITGADIFGFSNGGSTAMQVVIRHPQRVRKLVIASAFYKKEGLYSGFWDMMGKATFASMPQIYKDAFMNIRHDSAGLLNMYNKDVARMRSFKDWSDASVQSIQVPVLIVIGDHDVVRPEHAVEMFRILPHAQLSILPGGHGIYLGEALMPDTDSKVPALFTAMLEEFLAAPVAAAK